MPKVITKNNKVLVYNNQAMEYPGVIPTGNINITTTAQTDVTNYATAQVVDSNLSASNIKKDVSILGVTGSYEGSVGVQYIPRQIINEELQMPSGVYTLPNNIKKLNPYTLAYAFYQSSITSVNLSSLTSIGNYSMYYAFYQNNSLTSVDLSSVTTVGTNSLYYAFYMCTKLISVNFHNLTNIFTDKALYDAFCGCTKLESVDFSSLTAINGDSSMYYTFNNCPALTSVSFDSLTTIKGNSAMQYAFRICTSLTTLSFPSLISSGFGSYTNQFNNMLSGVTGCTVHFPSNLQSVIGGWSSVTGGFGGTSTTVLFDLPATN